MAKSQNGGAGMQTDLTSTRPDGTPQDPIEESGAVSASGSNPEEQRSGGRGSRGSSGSSAGSGSGSAAGTSAGSDQKNRTE